MKDRRAELSELRSLGARGIAGFDSGLGEVEVLKRLRVAADGELPQALEYLVGEASCYLVARDAALAAEVAADRAVRRLGLRVVGDVVLVGSRSREETLNGLRTAGYAPLDIADPDNEPAEAERDRTAQARRSGSLLDERVQALGRVSATSMSAAEALALAERLLAAPSGWASDDDLFEDDAFGLPWGEDPHDDPFAP